MGDWRRSTAVGRPSPLSARHQVGAWGRQEGTQGRLVNAAAALQDNPWESYLAIAVVSILATALISWLLHLRSKKTKHIDYEIVSDASLLSDRARDVDDLQVTIRGQAVVLPRIVTIRFVNTGNVEIKASDFVKPITVNHGGDPRALNVSLVQSSTAGMLEKLTDVRDGHTYVAISPRLINRGEQFTIQLLYEGIEPIDVSTWISGQTRPMRPIESQRVRATFGQFLGDILNQAGPTGRLVRAVIFRK